MEKLELKHLAGYLPYGINTNMGKLLGFVDIIQPCCAFKDDFGSSHIPVKFIKPILRPLSDLTKEIEVGGEKFVPIDWINENSPISKYYVKEIVGELFLLADHGIGYNVLSPLNPLYKLYEWHFDIHNLIPAGLAIDINTL